MSAELTLRGALLVAGGAVVGALLRWGAGAAFPRDFPWGIAAVNVAGSFLIGVLMFGAFARGIVGHDARLFLAIGVLGSFTTMSSFAFDTIEMVDQGHWARASLNVMVNPLLCLGAAFLGRATALALWSP